MDVSHLLEELNEAQLDAVTAKDGHVLVLAGAGKRFCAGADQAEMVERDSQDWEPIVRRDLDPVRALVSMDKPVVAALHGDAVGGGLGLALACDFRLAAESVPGSTIVRADFTDAFAEGGAQRRRWEYEHTGPDTYVERLFRASGDGWEALTEWAFTRVRR